MFLLKIIAEIAQGHDSEDGFDKLGVDRVRLKLELMVELMVDSTTMAIR
jgi:hypothetical protein